jgi:hypothetical protein
MGFPLERGSLEDGILTCHWHHARFDLESGCTFDLWTDDAPVCPIEIRNGDVWVKPTFGHANPASHWRQRLTDGLAHDLGLVVAKAVQGQLAADVPRADIVRQVGLFGAQNRDGWGVGLTILTALANLLLFLPRGGSISCPVPRGAPRRGGLRWRGASVRVWYSQIWLSCSRWGMFPLLPHDETHRGPIAYVRAGDGMLPRDKGRVRKAFSINAKEKRRAAFA